MLAAKFVAAVPDAWPLTNGALLVNKSLTILGSMTAGVTVSCNTNGRVFHTMSGNGTNANVTIANLTIANGKVFVGTAGDAEPLQRYHGPRPAFGPGNYYLAVYGLK